MTEQERTFLNKIWVASAIDTLTYIVSDNWSDEDDEKLTIAKDMLEDVYNILDAKIKIDEQDG